MSRFSWATILGPAGKWLSPDSECAVPPAEREYDPDPSLTEPIPVVGGSHDPLLEWALRESGSGLATLLEGSAAGLQRFVDGKLLAAAIHLHAFEDDRDENIAAMKSEPRLQGAMLVAFARREQGIVVAKGNPLGLQRVRDMAQENVRVAVRPPGAGAQLLLESALAREKTDLSKLTIVTPPCPTGSDIAQAVRLGRADCGMATRSAANAAGVGFVPVTWEWFDLVIRQRDFQHPQLQMVFDFLKTPIMRAYVEEAGGYDISMGGRVRFAP